MRLDDDLDRIMARDDEIVPSSGFASSVMDAVRSEAAAPPAIPFPWKRLLPGLVFAVFALGLAIIVGYDRLVATINTPLRLPAVLQPGLDAVSRSPLVANSGWIALSILVTALSAMFSTRWAARRQ
jgi:hypothetical protein